MFRAACGAYLANRSKYELDCRARALFAGDADLLRRWSELRDASLRLDATREAAAADASTKRRIAALRTESAGLRARFGGA